MRFILSHLILGVIVAAATIWLAPGLLQTERPVVEIHEALPTNRAAVVTTATTTAPDSYADAVMRAAPGVVNIYSAKRIAEPRHPFFDEPMLRRFFGERNEEPRKRLETSLGSGVVISSKGYVLTNNHVIEGADEIQVLLPDGRNTAATIVGTDPETDLAVLKIALSGLPTVTLGHSQTLRVGDVVLAIGNPFGIGQTVTQGIVSATGRSQLGLATFENFIQTDAAINPGNSGGALINTNGEVVGINTAIFSRTGGSLGIGFAIPISLARGVVKGIVENGRVIRGWIGVQVQGLPPRLAASPEPSTAHGVLIAGVLRDGPAARAGLRPGDVVLDINGRPIADIRDLLTIITAQKPGTTIMVSGLHSGSAFQRQVLVEERPRKL
ncbi:MAG TPA: trypsin-like peptidase domain-containing protein [Nitrococcus sp.]|nr:trypsin-like peptidase domain-containing protein [Nitrococcus sp.]